MYDALHVLLWRPQALHLHRLAEGCSEQDRDNWEAAFTQSAQRWLEGRVHTVADAMARCNDNATKAGLLKSEITCQVPSSVMTTDYMVTKLPHLFLPLPSDPSEAFLRQLNQTQRLQDSHPFLHALFVGRGNIVFDAEQADALWDVMRVLQGLADAQPIIGSEFTMADAQTITIQDALERSPALYAAIGHLLAPMEHLWRVMSLDGRAECQAVQLNDLPPTVRSIPAVSLVLIPRAEPAGPHCSQRV